MRFDRKAFTLVELLIVIIIIGVMAFVVGPSVTTGSDYARLKAASRGVVQLSRYARTMALLRQVPVDLVYASDGKLRVEPAAAVGEKLISADAFVRTNLLDEAEEIVTPSVRGESAAATAGGSSYQMADLEIEREYKQISFHFEGYTDTMDGGGRSGGLSPSWARGAPEEEEGGSASFRVHYRSNGTCRPHRVRIVAGGDDLEFMVVDVNMLGVARVLREDEL